MNDRGSAAVAGAGITGRHRKLPPLWSTLNQAPSVKEAGRLNQTTPPGSMPPGSSKIAVTSPARGGTNTPSTGIVYSSG